LTVTDADLDLSKSKSSMGPGQTEIFIATPRPKLNRPFTEQEVRGLADGVGAIYVYGRIRYRDAFGRTQLTNYRFMVGGPGGFSSGGEMAGCEEGNEAT
jgi:hypothetical protein